MKLTDVVTILGEAAAIAHMKTKASERTMLDPMLALDTSVSTGELSSLIQIIRIVASVWHNTFINYANCLQLFHVFIANILHDELARVDSGHNKTTTQGRKTILKG